jgi:RIO kinase 1
MGMERLQEILEEGIIDEVYSQLKTGKEAEVWLVSHRGQPVAAKLYKSRETRSFKNDAGYREGRQVRNSRTQRAMDRGTRFGRQASEDAWKSAEADALSMLHAAGVRVPKPVLFYEGVLLMEVIGDSEGRVAPRLVDAHIPKEQAMELYVSVRGEVIKMLAADLIHGDLSEFNVLLSHDGPVIIDFPQVVMAAKNSRSEHYFRKDLGNIVRFFSGIDPAVGARSSDVDEIWRAYVRRELSPGFVPASRARPQWHQKPAADGRRGRRDGPGFAPKAEPERRPSKAPVRRSPEVSFRGQPRVESSKGSGGRGRGGDGGNGSKRRH